MDKRVTSSHLSLRFYRCYGWTEEEILPLVERGFLSYHPSTEYWGQEVGSAFYVEKLIEAAGPIFHFSGRELQGEEAAAYVRSMNWSADCL